MSKIFKFTSRIVNDLANNFLWIFRFLTVRIKLLNSLTLGLSLLSVSSSVFGRTTTKDSSANLLFLTCYRWVIKVDHFRPFENCLLNRLNIFLWLIDFYFYSFFLPRFTSFFCATNFFWGCVFVVQRPGYRWIWFFDGQGFLRYC